MPEAVFSGDYHSAKEWVLRTSNRDGKTGNYSPGTPLAVRECRPSMKVGVRADSYRPSGMTIFQVRVIDVFFIASNPGGPSPVARKRWVG